METANGLSNLKNPVYAGKYEPFHPFSFRPDSSSIESQENFKYGENMNYHRCSSESCLFEEQPSWLEDLLKDPESPFQSGHHRRTVSDSFAYLEEAAETVTECEESKYGFADYGAPTVSQNLMNYKHLGSTSDTKAASLVEKSNQDPEEVLSTLDLEHSRDESSPPNLDKDTGSQAKPAGSKSDSKQKQHNAHRSRVRKLQYIAHLEKTVEMLKTEGFGNSADLEFLEQQNMILTMENRALRQRLESFSQEQMIKQWEQGMLEREIARLQTLYHLQKQQQMHMPQQKQQKQQQKHRKNKSRDLDHQVTASMQKNVGSSNNSSKRWF